LFLNILGAISAYGDFKRCLDIFVNVVFRHKLFKGVMNEEIEGRIETRDLQMQKESALEGRET
jgi:hypothetical protein